MFVGIYRQNLQDLVGSFIKMLTDTVIVSGLKF